MQKEIFNIKEIEFETHDKHRKGILTEDAALNLTTSLTKSLKIDILRRVIPPVDSYVGECDAIIFADSGLYLVEIKRYAGLIKNLNSSSNSLKIEQSADENRSIENPVPRLLSTTEKLSKFVNESYEWRFVKKLFEISKISNSIPVFPLLCFGPSTKIENNNVESEVIIVNTRTISKVLKETILSEKSILGLSRQMKIAAHRWHIQGKITIKGKSGFLRAYPHRALGQTVSFSEATKITCEKGKNFKIIYGDRLTKTSKLVEGIIFKHRSKNGWQDILVNNSVNFNWKSGG